MSKNNSLTGGRRRDGKPYKSGNTDQDGDYLVGKNRPPKSGQFATGDGRKRGRRPKGVRNHDTEFLEELDRKIVVRENGSERKVTKGRAADIRLIENGLKGQNRALELIDGRRQRVTQKAEAATVHSRASDFELMDAWFAERMAQQQMDPADYGDPIPSGSDEEE